MSTKLALGLEYCGTRYHGWQRQTAIPTVQAEFEHACHKIANHPVNSIAAGRTDAGVHAVEQVVHIDVTAERPAYNWLCGLNSTLPTDIAVRWVIPVSEHFHARYSATARQYRYLIYNHPARSALWHQRAWWIPQTLDIECMQRACQDLYGQHDFKSFQGRDCQSKTSIRTITSCVITQRHAVIELEISANAFLHHMVRNIVGSLVAIGLKKQSQTWLGALLQIRQRAQAGAMAPAAGLYLNKVSYPSTLLPETSVQDFTEHPMKVI